VTLARTRSTSSVARSHASSPVSPAPRLWAKTPAKMRSEREEDTGALHIFARLRHPTLLGAAIYLCSLRLISPRTTADLVALVRPLLARVPLKATGAPLASEHGR